MRTHDMKKLLVALSLIIPLMAIAKTEEADGVEWSYEVKNGTAQIYYAVSSNVVNTITIPSKLGGCPVTSVDMRMGRNGFGKRCLGLELCDNITAVVIPSTVTNIGRSSFVCFWRLKSFLVDEKNAVYSSRNGLLCSKDGSILLLGVNGDVAVPSCVSRIGEYAFANCRKLTCVTMPSSVCHIGDYAFGGCPELITITIPSSVKVIGNGAFHRCIGLTNLTLTAGLTSIGGDIEPRVRHAGAFEGCIGLKSVTIPLGVTDIKDSAFSKCSGLASVTIPYSVTNIGQHAFSGCVGLKSATIPSGVTEIKDCAFHGCAGLTSVAIPSSVTEIGCSAFSGCVGLKSVTIPNGVLEIRGYSFYGCRGLTTVNIPSGVRTIGGLAFGNCIGLLNLTMPDDVTRIGEGGFWGCCSLASVQIPSSVSVMEYSAFRGCSSLKSIAIPANVTNIGNGAFADCDKLSAIEVAPENRVFASVGGILFTKDMRNLIACPGAIKSVAIPQSVTNISRLAFSGCNGLKTITIPSSVESVENNVTRGRAMYFSDSQDRSAFSGHNELIEINVEPGNQSYTSENGVLFTKDRGRLVACPGGLTTVLIPASVTNISEQIFRESDKLRQIKVEPGNPKYSSIDGVLYGRDWQFSRSQSQPWSRRRPSRSGNGNRINGLMLMRCPAGLTSLEIPDGVTAIDGWAFNCCRKLTSVSIPASVMRIGCSAFGGCKELTSVSIPASVMRIGCSAFGGCKELTSVRMSCECPIARPQSVFSGCDKLASISVPSNSQSWVRVTKWSDVPVVRDADLQPAFGDELVNTAVVDGVTWSYTVRNGEATLVDRVGVLRLRRGVYRPGRVEIPSRLGGVSVKNIGPNAFDSRCGYKSVMIPSGVRNIEGYAFARCSDLSHVMIPSTVTNIDRWAFWECPKLKSIDIERDGKVDSVLLEELFKRPEPKCTDGNVCGKKGECSRLESRGSETNAVIKKRDCPIKKLRERLNRKKEGKD